MCFGGKAKTPSLPPATPPPPVVDEASSNDAVKKAQKKYTNASQRAVGMEKTILTDPLGVAGAADIQKKTLLGS